MNAQKVVELREKLRERINVAIENGIVFGGDIDEIESLCRQIEQARKEPMPCRVCGVIPTEFFSGTNSLRSAYVVMCAGQCGIQKSAPTPAQAIEAWDKEQQQ